ncbi:MAG: hypothetical protein HS122_13145 [Opitutaceae bacterium]|nr:hypothetical protein [Opitutaceae bacterium]
MVHETCYLNFTRTAITARWRRDGENWVKTNGFINPLSAKGSGKVYIFADAKWPFYVDKASQSIGSRVGQAFRCTPHNRAKGFAGYRCKQRMTESFLHVFMGPPENPWSSEDAECIEAEVVFRIRQAGAWPVYRTEIHFSKPAPRHEKSADAIMAYFTRLKAHRGLSRP